MNNKVSNPKVEVPVTKQMNDKDYLSSVLEHEKNMVNNYSYALNEASNDVLYSEIKCIFDETSSCQREVFNLLFKNGWYSLDKADNAEITTKYNEYTTNLKEL